MTPSDFIFSCKANRYITHQKKLHEVEESVERLLSVFECFGEKLGPILFQFPPSWEVNIERLKSFISHLSSAFQYTFEFRAQSWFCPELYDLLAKHKMSLCVYNYKGIESPEILCGDFMYMRMHGPEKTAYTGSYTDEQLENWAKKIRNWQQMGKAIYCYFDNDQKAHAPHDARRLRKLLNDQI